MFRIECFVTDKHLPDVLRALGQRVMNLSVQPVVDAAVEKKGKGEPKLKATTNGTGLEGFLRELTKHPTINVGSAEAACQAAGLSPSSKNHFLGAAIKRGIIVRRGKGTGTTYAWAKPPTLGKEPKREAK